MLIKVVLKLTFGMELSPFKFTNLLTSLDLILNPRLRVNFWPALGMNMTLMFCFPPGCSSPLSGKMWNTSDLGLPVLFFKKFDSAGTTLLFSKRK